MNPNGFTRDIRNDPELQAGYGVEYAELGAIRYVISGPGYRRARDRAQAAARIPFAWHAAPGRHDISAGQVRDRPNLDRHAARGSTPSRARKLLGPHDCDADIRFEALRIKTHRLCGHWRWVPAGR